MLIYLASPYTHPDREVEDLRARLVTIVAGELIKKGMHLFCPVAHCHFMNRLCQLGGDFDYWREYDEMMLSFCDELWIATLDGWRKSKGVTYEREYARDQGMPIRYINPVTLDVSEAEPSK